MRVIDTERLPIKMWLDDIEDRALQQAKDLANLPFVHKHIAIMPDSHQGYGMPIGGVMATRGVVVPNAVGVDIGCGMCAVAMALSCKHFTKEKLTSIVNDINRLIPTGFNHHQTPREWDGFNAVPDIPIIRQELESARYQMGTLGGGNHFIEIQKSNINGQVWIMLHSGSRNFGFKIAKEYHERAKRLCERWYSDIPNRDLAFLPIETKEAKEYLEAMNYALRFAEESRKRMRWAVEGIFKDHFMGIWFSQPIDIHHNYAAWENHFGKNVLVHRKGATSAKEGQLGIIPGSQGTKSYIVMGLGNPQSFMSCSHGAGRRMGRAQARRELSLEDEKRILDERGIIHSIENEYDLDEAPSAYKDIDVVMENQKDLVSIQVELEPLAVIKAKESAK